MKFLIVTNPEDNISISPNEYDYLIYLDEKYATTEDILAFIPNREIQSQAKENLCFINYGPRNWEYKQNARKIRYNLGEEKFTLIENHVTYQIHNNIGLDHHEEVNLLILTIEFCLSYNYEVAVSKKVPLSNLEDKYLDTLINTGKVKILNE